MRGPRPSHVLEFTTEDLDLARRTVRKYSKAFHQVVRAKLALLLAGEPLISHEEAAGVVGLSVPAVRKWRRRWDVDGFSLTDAPRPGRPRSFSPSGGGCCKSIGV